jgi:hypothetical protein
MTAKTRPPQTQFPPDPNRASEAGFTYGEAGPEKAGRQMRTPPVDPPAVEPSANERATAAEQAEARDEAAHNRELEKKLRAEEEKISPRGNYRK